MKEPNRDKSKITSKDLAKILGFSQSTISRALNDNPSISSQHRKLIQDKARELGFIFNSQARSLKTKKTGVIGILFPLYFQSLSINLMFSRIVDTLQPELVKNNYEIMILYDCEQTAGASVLERTVKGHKVDGIINLRPFLSDSELRLINENNCPLVSLFYAEQDNPSLHQFRMDEYDSGYIAGHFFSGFEDRKNYFLTLPLDSINSRTRLKGYMDGLGEKKIDRVFSCGLSMHDAYVTTKDNIDVFHECKSNIYVYNDMMAIGVVRALLDAGIDIPNQVQIIGMDDIPMATWTPPALSTLHTPLEIMVKDSCHKLYSLINGEHSSEATIKFYKLTLIHRDTTLVKA